MCDVKDCKLMVQPAKWLDHEDHIFTAIHILPLGIATVRGGWFWNHGGRLPASPLTIPVPRVRVDVS